MLEILETPPFVRYAGTRQDVARPACVPCSADAKPALLGLGVRGIGPLPYQSWPAVC